MKKAKGQALVEFTLILPLFLALMTGLLDGSRLLFTYNEVQESARVGARYGAISVGRDCGGDFGHFGNSTATTNFNVLSYTPSGCVNAVHTIAGEVSSKLMAVDQSKVTLGITTLAGSNVDTGSTTSQYRGNSVTVKVSYTFYPMLAFGRVGIPLAAKVTMYHE